jgi:hypothetical protein
MTTTVQSIENKELLQQTGAHKKEKFIGNVIHDNALACNNVRSEKFNLEKAKKVSECGMTALNVHGGLQAMVAAQMLAIHDLQQKSMIYANGCSVSDLESKQYFTNTAIKLSNTFCTQAQLLAKLQGLGGQKLVVERVDVSHGGQAVIGNINSQDRF